MNDGLEVLLSDDFTGDFDLTTWTIDLDIRHYPVPPPSNVEVTAGDGNRSYLCIHFCHGGARHHGLWRFHITGSSV